MMKIRTREERKAVRHKIIKIAGAVAFVLIAVILLCGGAV